MNLTQHSLLHHFKELKLRLIYILSFYFVFLAIAYYYSEELYQFLIKPLHEIDACAGRKMIYTNLTEAFFSYLKLASIVAFMFILPITAYQIYRFLAPGLYKEEQLLLTLTLVASPILFWLGVIFCYYLVLPKAWQFFLSFENNSAIPIVLEAKISEYLQLIIDITMAFGIAFQLPVILIILTILHIISSKTLEHKRRYAIVLMFILGGILTPPDIFSQFALAIPLILLYEISIKLCRIVENKRKIHVRS